MSEPVAPKWRVTVWRDRNGRQWQAKKNGRWYSPYGELFIDGYADALVDSVDELRAVHGPLTPLAVDNVPALLADESRYRQLWSAQVRDRQSEPRDPAKDAAESALWETFRGIVRRAEAERDAAEAVVDATRQMAITASAALRDQLLAALDRQDDGRTPLSEYVAALIADRDTMREVAEANKRNHGILAEAYQQLEADIAKLKATIDTYLATDERGVHDAANLAHARTERAKLAELENAICWDTTCLSCAAVLDASHRETERAEKAEAERDALRQHILDIDAHATPYGDIPDEPGWIGTYLVTAGALHRALGKIGHSAPRCQAEADNELLLQAVDAQQSLRRSAEEKLIATHQKLAAARRELATLAEKIATGLEELATDARNHAEDAHTVPELAAILPIEANAFMAAAQAIRDGDVLRAADVDPAVYAPSQSGTGSEPTGDQVPG